MSPGFNQTALWENGYGDATQYFYGLSRFNETLAGWSGHDERLGHQGTVADVLAKVRSFTPIAPVSWVGLLGKTKWVELDLENIKTIVNFPDNCIKIDLPTTGSKEEQIGNHKSRGL